ncbi:MAG: ElyC/SanA/YdcF family protein [Nanobdellota archaeon]
MINQQLRIETYTEPEAIVLLGGENPKHKSRSEGVIQYFIKRQQLLTRNSTELPATKPWLFITGKEDTLEPKRIAVAQANEMKDYILNIAKAKGAEITEEDIGCQKEGLDTLAQMYYAEQDLISPAFYDQKEASIALVTDSYHMPRAYWAAQQVLSQKRTGKKYTIHQIPTDGTPSDKWKIKENGTLLAWKIDLAIYGLDTYMDKIHPLHGKKAHKKFSTYKQGMNIIGVNDNTNNKNTIRTATANYQW